MPARRIPLSYRWHITGYQPFITGARPIGHESLLERDFVTLCRFDPDVRGIEEQPVTINWIDINGRRRRYTPDYRVIRRSGAEIVEVKYRSDLWTKWTDYRPGFVAARDWAVARGMRFRIVTERQIRTPKLSNARRLLPRIDEPVSAEITNHILGVIGRLQPISLSDAIEHAIAPEWPREVVLSAIWPLLARRCIIIALDVEISGSTMLSLPGAQR
jgi:hypothetical protein